MSKVQESILNQQPFSRRRPGEVVPEPAEVEEALNECGRRGLRDLASGRVAAYAWYQGVQNDTVLHLFRTTGAQSVLLRELSAHKARDRTNDAQLVASLEHRGIPSELARALGDPDAGWALAVVSAVELADFEALISSVGAQEDVMQLIPLYFFVTIVPFTFRLSLTKKFLSLSDAFFRDVFISLLCRWSEDAVALEDHPITAIISEIEGSPTHRVIAIGALFDYIFRRFAYARLPDDQQARLDQVWEQINNAGKRVVEKAADLDAVLSQAGTRDLDVLAAMSRWRSGDEVEPELGRRMGKRAADFLRRSFASAMYEPEGEGPAAAFSERIINPLIEALKHDGITVDQFRTLYERLASDAFSRMTRYATWINDRKRGVVLIVIAGMVARERSDDALLAAVEQAAAEMLSQPEGFLRVLTPESAKKVEDRLGFPIPLA